jgi:insulysin
MSEADFANFVQVVVENKLEKDKTLSQESSRHFIEISRHRYDFERKEHEVAALKALTQNDLIEFFQKYVSIDSNTSCRRFVVHIFGKDHEVTTADGTKSYVQNIGEFQRKQSLFPSFA